MFKAVTPKPDFIEIENRLLKWWEENGIVDKYLHKNDSSKEKFSFLDGPITANNPMGVHHAWGRTLKDVWQRYFNMKGKKQRFQNGFDNQGLWVEVEVEKDLGFRSKRDIEKYGVGEFVDKCKERTLKYAKIQTEQSKRLGYFMDWNNSYYTMSDDNNYMIWYFLKKCSDNGWIYKGHDSVPWCPRCGTAISQHEILTEEYKELTHISVFFKVRIEDGFWSRLNLPPQNDKNRHPGNPDEVGSIQDQVYFLVWTTTPWTIPANVALAVHPEFTYAAFKNKNTGETLIFLKDLSSKVLDEQWEIIKEYKGSDLAGLHYVGPFDDLERVQKAKQEKPQTFHGVFADETMVTAEEGTGIVHIAPGCGEEDYQLGKKVDMPVIEAIDESAFYLDGFGKFSALNAKTHPELIFDALKEIENGNFLFKLEPYTHRYPTCWRCRTELVWRVVDEWYISMEELRFKIMEVVKKVNWIPSWGYDREMDWLKNMHDWMISKKRYWGLALPIYECKKCGSFEVIGSKEELKEKAVAGWDKFEGHTPHKPFIDEVKIKCSKCGENVSRIPDVGNPWLDAGIVPFSTLVDPKTKKLSYTSDKKYWEEWFPADFITESFPGQFKNWFYSLLTMATVLEDKTPFKTLLGYASVRDEKGEEMHKSKGNAIWFDEGVEKIGADVMRWMYCLQNPELNLNFGYKTADETRRKFHLLLWNIYNFFITYANTDGWEKDTKKKSVTSKNILDIWILSRLNELVKIVTGSLDKYDAPTATNAIEEFVSDLSTWFVRRSRDRIGPSTENGADKNAAYETLWEVLASIAEILAPFTPFLAEELYQNLTNEARLPAGQESVHLSSWPTVGKIDGGLNADMKLVREVCEAGHAQRKTSEIKVRQPLSKIQITSRVLKVPELENEYKELIAKELNIKEVTWEQKGTETTTSAILDTEITHELKEEGEARDLIRQIQEARKTAGCALDERINVVLPVWPKKFEEHILKETLADKLITGAELAISRK